MAGSTGNSSFIPKRGTQKRRRRVRNGNVYILTIVSYVVLFATLVASAAVFVYGQYVGGQLQNEIAQMNAAVSDFREADMQRVQEFDVRLRQANQRLDNSASVVSIFNAIEEATIDTVRFENLSLVRYLDDEFVINAILQTDTFDSSLFQRGIFEDDGVVQTVEFTSLQLEEAVDDSGLTVGQSITLVANLAIPLDVVPFQADGTDEVTPVIAPTPIIEAPAEEAVEEVNETDV